MDWNSLYCRPNCDGPEPCMVAPSYCDLYATPEECCEQNYQDADCALLLPPPPAEDCPVEGECLNRDGECKQKVNCLADPCLYNQYNHCLSNEVCVANYCGGCDHDCIPASSNLFENRRQLNIFLDESMSSMACSESEMPLVVDIVTGEDPASISWKMTDTCTGFDMNSVPMDSLYSLPSTLYSISWCVPSSEYKFTISGDLKSYAVMYDGEKKAYGGGLVTSESTIFGACASNPTTMVSTFLFF